MRDLSFGQVFGAIITLGAVIAVVGGWVRWVRPRWRSLNRKVTAALDSLVGRPEVRDSITDEVRIPALPGMGVRMAAQEQQTELLVVTVTKLVDQQEHQVKLERRVDQVEADIADLKAAQVERLVGKAESVAMYRAIETAIKASPDVESEADEDE